MVMCVQMSWTHALRQIVINCYKYHGREDLLPAFTEDEDDKQAPQTVRTLHTYTPIATCLNIITKFNITHVLI